MSVLDLYLLIILRYIKDYYIKFTPLSKLKSMLLIFLLRHIDYKLLVFLAGVLSFCIRKKNWLNNSFGQTHFNVLGYNCRNTHSEGVLKQRILRNALIYENKKLVSQLEKCASDIRKYIEKNDITSEVIFAPLHTVSDFLQTAIAALVFKKPLVVVSVYNDMKVLVEQRKTNVYGICIEQFNPESMMGDAGSDYQDVILSLIDKKVNLAIFPDAVPECTTKIAKKKMKTYAVTLFKRHSELHTGLPVFSRLLKQKVLFYTLCMDKKYNLKVNVLDCIEHHEVKEKMPELVEEGIRKCSHEWTLWHYTSFYGYNY